MKKLLIADDEKVLHGFYSEIFSSRYEIIHAFDGAEALMLAVEHRPDIMILDIMMPLLDGRTVCRKIKGNERTAGTKIVMVSAKNDQHDRLLGFEVGADDYIEKPACPSYLARSVGRLLQ